MASFQDVLAMREPYPPPRRNLGAAIALFCLVALAAGWFAWPLFASEPKSVIRSYTVEISFHTGKNGEGGTDSGSGVVIGHAPIYLGQSRRVSGERSFILTNEHVVKGAPAEVNVQWRGKKLAGYVRDTDPAYDLAIVEVDANLPAAPLYFGKLIIDEPVTALGNQEGEGLLMSDGHVGPANEAANGLVEISAPVYGGSSGSGFFVERGGRYKLAGIVEAESAYMIQTASGPVKVPMPTRGYAIPMWRVRMFLIGLGYMK